MAGANEDLIAESIDAVLRATTIEDALDGVVVVLRSPFHLWQAALWVFEAEDSIRCVASWTPAGGVWQPGVVIRFTLTPDVEELARAVLRGRPTLVDPRRHDLGLIGEIIRQEGVVSAVALPLKRGRSAAGMLALGSSRDDAFGPTDLRLLGGIARGVTKSLLGLMERAGGRTPSDGSEHGGGTGYL